MILKSRVHVDTNSHQEKDATKIPIPMQSTNTTYSKNLRKDQKPRPKTTANPIEVIHNQAVNNTKKAGSSLANWDLVSKTQDHKLKYLPDVSNLQATGWTYVFYSENFYKLFVETWINKSFAM